MTSYDFPHASPKEMGVDAKAIAHTIKGIREEGHLELHSFLMLRRGVMIHEEYFRPDEASRLHRLYSVSKSFMSTAMGLADAQGLLSLDDFLFDFFPEHKALCDDPRKAKVQLKHLLMMGSGFANNEGEIFRKETADLVAAALAQPMVAEPGEVFSYYTLGSYLLSVVFSRVCPEGIHAYIKRKLFHPAGFGTSKWERDKNGVPMGGFGLSLTAKDLARMGQIYLQKGQWEGQQLVPEAYVAEATRKHIDNSLTAGGQPDWGAGYGYQFWRNVAGGFRADGMYGQYILMFPEQEAVVVMTSHLKEMQLPMTMIAERLLPKIK